jgi:hypothetical protein
MGLYIRQSYSNHFKQQCSSIGTRVSKKEIRYNKSMEEKEFKKFVKDWVKNEWPDFMMKVG